MEISNLNQAPTQVSNQLASSPDILSSLRRLGGIDATVVRIDKTGVLLATRLGELIGKNPLDLKVGDQLRIKVGGQESNPVLKISKAPVERIILSATRQPALTQTLPPNQPQTARVTARNNQSLNISLNANQYTINQPVDLKVGQLISLVYRPDKSQVEIRPVNTEQVLKSALVRLLPQVMQAGSGNSLVSLVKIIQSLKPGSAASASGPAAQNPASPEQAGTQVQLITKLLSLLQSVPRITTLDKTVIQQWAGFDGPDRADRNAGGAKPESPFSLLKQLPANEADLRPLLQQWVKQLSTTPKLHPQMATNMEPLDNEAFSSVAKDILKLVEQSLNQLQFQQTSLRYQQELQQPINLALTIPLTEDQSTRPLQLSIREGKSSANNEDNSWDIDLSFEFGLLGLISSHINLDGITISTTFWSSHEDTRLKIDQALPEFKQQLLNSGFEPGRFFSLAGPAPKTVEQHGSFYANSLLDIRV